MTIAASPPTCLQCGGPTVAAFRVQDRNQHLSDAWFTYQRCTRCASRFLAPIPEDLGRYYRTDYPAYKVADLQSRMTRERCKLDLLRPHVASGRMLEIGPAIGAFAKLAQESGFAIEVIEMDRDCCAYIERALGIPARHSIDAGAALLPGESFDVIVLWHVIEHLPNPLSTLTTLAAHVRPGGLLALSAPNPESLQFRLLGARWVHVDAPRHLWLIPLGVISERLELLGFELLSATACDPIGLALNRMGWRSSLDSLSSWRPLRFALRCLGEIANLVCAPWERRLAGGSTYTAVFRKKPGAGPHKAQDQRP